MWGLRTSALRLGYVASLPQTSSSSSRFSTMVSKKVWTRRDNVVISCVCQQQVRWFARPSIGNAKSSVHKIKAKEIIKNSEISKDYNELRVVYTDDSTGKDEHKIMSRLEALNLAKSMSLDLILVAGNSNPPVCRIDDSGLKRVEQEKKVKEMKAKAKSKIVKEIHVGCTIGPHDLEVKMNKVREFLEDGHPVRVSFIGKPRQLNMNPLVLDQAILRVLELIEKDASTVQPLKTKSILRKDILVSPLKKEKDNMAQQ